MVPVSLLEGQRSIASATLMASSEKRVAILLPQQHYQMMMVGAPQDNKELLSLVYIYK